MAPAPIDAGVADRAADLGERLAVAMGLTGTLTAELFLMPDGRLVVNELAPRVHNSGHWTIEGAATSQFEQHIRAICGLGLGSTVALAPTADGQPAGHRPGPARASRAARPGACPGRPGGPSPPLRQAAVFERRKMGHVTAIGGTIDEALARARTAAGHAALGRIDPSLRARDGRA